MFCIVSRSQGFQDTIKHEINGYLYRLNHYNDTGKGLKLLLDKDSNNISETCKEMNIDKCTENVLKLYDETIQNHRKQRNCCEIFQIFTLNIIMTTTSHLDTIVDCYIYQNIDY